MFFHCLQHHHRFIQFASYHCARNLPAILSFLKLILGLLQQSRENRLSLVQVGSGEERDSQKHLHQQLLTKSNSRERMVAVSKNAINCPNDVLDAGKAESKDSSYN